MDQRQLFIAHTVWMQVMWLLHFSIRNAGLVDLAWPTGFTAMAAHTFVYGQGYYMRKALICGMYIVCGSRFIFGWIQRTIHDGEDKRWKLWRHRWSNGEGWFGISSISANLLFFYHAQSLFNIFLMSAPLQLACANKDSQIALLEWIATTIWLSSFAVENLADLQLSKFCKNTENRGKVCEAGLWKYSRHPNYAGELGVHVAYALFALPSASPGDVPRLALYLAATYYFLVHFTGVWITEQGSLRSRGAAYQDYQRRVPALWPRLPRLFF